MKKTASIFLCLAFLLSLCSFSVLAAETPVTNAEELTAAVEESGTVILGDNITQSITIPAGKTVTLDLNGYTLTNTSGSATVTNRGTLVIVDTKGTGVVDCITSGKAALVNDPGADLKLQGGTVTRSAETGKGYYTVINNGTMEIAGGKVSNTCTTSTASLIINGSGKPATLTISGGVIEQAAGIAVKNEEYGDTLYITEGIITSRDQAVQNWGTAYISGGIMDGNVNSWTYTGQATGSSVEISGTAKVEGDVIAASYDAGAAPEQKISVKGGTVEGKVYEALWNGSTPVEKDPGSMAAANITVEAGSFGSPVAEDYVEASATVASLTSGQATQYYIGTSENVAKTLETIIVSGDAVEVKKGDLSLGNIAGNVTVTNTGSGSVTVENEPVTEDGLVTHQHAAQHVEAKEPTATENGNIEYWYCAGCGKYFKDQALTQEISKEATVRPATGETERPESSEDPESSTSVPPTGESAGPLWILLSVMLGAGVLGTMLTLKKRQAE